MNTWSPLWATHVVGTWTARTVDEETGEIEPSIVSMECGICKDKHKVECRSGNVKTWINKFASVHYHSDPLSPLSASEQVRVLKEARAKRQAGSTTVTSSDTTSLIPKPTKKS